MTTLALRLIGPSDYVVIDEGHRVGRIRRAAERINEVWLWNVTVAVPGGGHGTSTSLDAAKFAFRESWIEFKAEIGPERLAKALELARAVEGQMTGRDILDIFACVLAAQHSLGGLQREHSNT
jgi:hypothetical protein